MHKCLDEMGTAQWQVIIAKLLPVVSDRDRMLKNIVAHHSLWKNNNAQIMRCVLRNNKVIIAILLPVDMDNDKKHKYILAHD